MNEKNVIKIICDAIEDHGLMATIDRLFGAGTIIQMPFSETTCNKSIEELNLSVRSYNCLMRSNIKTVGAVVDTIMDDKLSQIRNLGIKSKAEIKATIYEYGYLNLSDERKKGVVKSILDLNKDKYTTT